MQSSYTQQADVLSNPALDDYMVRCTGRSSNNSNWSWPASARTAEAQTTAHMPVKQLVEGSRAQIHGSGASFKRPGQVSLATSLTSLGQLVN